ncbi:MAG: inorganic diphosphatase [Melioribacteraceae bacterium]|nr:inorganic diphosphatase [Melioribacteraceae bacterium]
MKIEELKYLNREIEVLIDRPIGSMHPEAHFRYELNYGYIPGTMGGDGEEIDAYILDINFPIEKIKGEVIGIIHRLNDSENKLLISVSKKTFTKSEIMKLTHFQEKFFKIIILLK